MKEIKVKISAEELEYGDEWECIRTEWPANTSVYTYQKFENGEDGKRIMKEEYATAFASRIAGRDFSRVICAKDENESILNHLKLCKMAYEIEIQSLELSMKPF